MNFGVVKYIEWVNNVDMSQWLSHIETVCKGCKIVGDYECYILIDDNEHTDVEMRKPDDDLIGYEVYEIIAANECCWSLDKDISLVRFCTIDGDVSFVFEKDILAKNTRHDYYVIVDNKLLWAGAI